MGEQTWNIDNATIKRTNWTKFTEIRTKFVRIWYEFDISFCIHTQAYTLGTKFVQILFEFHVNFVQFANKESKHTSKHTLQSHVITCD